MKKYVKKWIAMGLAAVISLNCLGMVSFADEQSNDVLVEISEARRIEAQAELDSLNLTQLYQNNNWINDASTYSEFDIYEKLATVPSTQLEEDGYTSREIVFIRDFRNKMDEHVKRMKTLDDNSLRKFGYTSDQIRAIRRYDGSDEALSRAAATVSVGLTIDYCTYNASINRTSSRIRFNFSWNGQPAIKLKDMMTVGWDGWMEAGKSANVQYQYIYSGGTAKNQTPTYVNPSNGVAYGGGYKFNATIDNNYYYAQTGNCAFVVDSAGERDMHTTGAFAHQTIGIEPSFSVTVSSSGVSPVISINLVNTNAEKTTSASRRVTR